MTDGTIAFNDIDPEETAEWVESFDSVLAHDGDDRAAYLLKLVVEHAQRSGVTAKIPRDTDYVNTVAAAADLPYPGDEAIERRLRQINRWNAAMMVSQANKKSDGLGGHMSTYASSATFLEVGFNHIFRGKEGAKDRGDQVYFQGHGSPGLYARAFLEGRLELSHLENFRREVDRGTGLSSYPHPRLMPEFWEFPTVSMGLGPLNAIYQARFNRYLAARGLAETSDCQVMCFMGDGECDEPESLGALSIAAREGLDNLTFVINCNLQRLDGPVRGNGKIVQELERIFKGAGWNVVKCLWGRGWDPLFAADADGQLTQLVNEIVDGDLQRFMHFERDETQSEFFGRNEAAASLFETLGVRGEDLLRGGHDPVKIYSAYQAARSHRGAPSVILFQTVKGWGLGPSFEGSNPTHQMKKLTDPQRADLRDRLDIPLSDSDLEANPFYHPGEMSAEVQYIRERRAALKGFLPARKVQIIPQDLKLPDDSLYADFYLGSKGRETSTTIACVGIMTKLLGDKSIGARIVPIVPDESRTFGMEALFTKVGIYAPFDQAYTPIDRKSLMYYKEKVDGQLLQEGINEAGAMASFTAAGTAYSVHGQPMIPFFIYYSMFGFQRVGDLIWSFADARGRGFLLGATAGRTSLNGEGLQHEDGHSHVLASTLPNIRAYDPAFGYEIAAILKDGLKSMIDDDQDVFYYLTLQNDNYEMPPAPDIDDLDDKIVRGIYLLQEAEIESDKQVQIFGSAVMINAALKAQQILADDYGVAADVWSVTSYQALRNDALAVERNNRLHPKTKAPQPFITEALAGHDGPIIAVTDFMKSVADQVSRFVPNRFIPLGTDGFGMSDSREALRSHFEVDAASVTIAALDGLRLDGKIGIRELKKAIKDSGIDPDKTDPASI
ncbi:MAG: pyruvate dehydrogenase (acetyl-transferring), homodimeric type [Planctomycetota bacterium]